MPYAASFPHRSTGYDITSANWNDIMDALTFLKEVAYAEFTADVAVTATTVGTATDIVSSGAVTYEAVPHLIEFFCGRVALGAGANIILKDGATVLGTFSALPLAEVPGPVLLQRRITPTAASHTYKVSAWNAAAGTNTYKAGTGGTAGDGTTFLPGFIRVTRIPT